MTFGVLFYQLHGSFILVGEQWLGKNSRAYDSQAPRAHVGIVFFLIWDLGSRFQNLGLCVEQLLVAKTLKPVA